MRTSSVISKAYDLTADKRLITKQDETVARDKVQALFDSCGYDEVLVPLNYYLKVIGEIDVSAIHYMDDSQTSGLLNDIHIAYLLLLAQEQYERGYQKLENAKHYSKERIKCEQLLDVLQGRRQSIYSNSPKVTSLTKNIIGPMGTFNEKRLYWVWASSLINTILSFIPVDFHHVQNAFNVMRTLPHSIQASLAGLYITRVSSSISRCSQKTLSKGHGSRWMIKNHAGGTHPSMSDSSVNGTNENLVF